MSDSYLATLERLADGCSSGGHLLCAHTLECRLALDEVVAAKNSREMAAKFDAGRERLSLQFEQPSETWSTSVLRLKFDSEVVQGIRGSVRPIWSR